MMVPTIDISEKLHLLLKKTQETENGFKMAAQKVTNASLQLFFKDKAAERYMFIYELQYELTSLGKPSPKDHTSYNSWIDINTMFDSTDENEIMEQAIFIEKAMLREYNEILQGTKIPYTTHLLLEHQKNKIDKGFSPIESIEQL